MTADDAFDVYGSGLAPKLQRTGSARQSRHQLRIQRPQPVRTLEHQFTPLSAASSSFNSPYVQSPITPYDNGTPLSAISTTFVPFQRSHHTMPPTMDRHDSLGGRFYSQLDQMKLSSTLEHRGQTSLPMQHQKSVPSSHVPDTYELDPSSLRLKLEPTTTPFAVGTPTRQPLKHNLRRSSNPGPGPRYMSNMPPPHFFAEDKKLSPTRLLAPRPSPGSLASRSLSSSPNAAVMYHQVVRPIKVEGVDKYQIPRLERTKVEKQKLFCDQCNKQPDGFRGAHELQRHKDAQHSRVRKVWVCIDGSEEQNMLSSCKNCRALKTYPAYYNAAAHLRRMHFKPKPEGAKGKSNRAGSGGGDDPPIEILKKSWMKQVVEVDGKITCDADAHEDLPEDDTASEDEDISVESLDAMHELDEQADEAAERAIPQLSSTLDTIGSLADVSPPPEMDEFADFDCDCDSLDTDLLDTEVNVSSNGGELQHTLCDSLQTTGSGFLNAAACFASELDFSEIFSVPEFLPST